ncbi:MAG TPA: hypothetical protein VFG35_20890 [Actinoplanes sp.]|nr:hypothetical protein [Actinoplanes sp.]
MSAVRRVRDHIDRLSAAPRTLSDLAAPGGSPTRTSRSWSCP